jgi:enoyl-CoA hydratase/carnithine racemase
VPVRLDRDGSTAILLLDRPEKGNSLDAPMLLNELPAAWCTIRDDPSIRVVIVTGAGSESFTTGADVTDPELVTGLGTSGDRPLMRYTGRQFDVWKPIITAVNGRCFGGGLWFLGDCDLALAAEHATFSNPATSVGMVVASGSIALARRASFSTVLRMAVLGRHDTLSAADALAAGIVTEVVPGDRLVDRALDYAARIARNSPRALEAMLRVLWTAQSQPLDEALLLADEVQTGWRGHPDAIEGPRAFAERREPNWEEA